MEKASLILNIVFLIILVYFIWKKANTVYKKLYKSVLKNYFLLFVISHFLMTVFHWHWSLEHGKDALSFFQRAVITDSWLSLFGVGSTFVSFLIYPLVKIGISYFTLFVLFSVISFYGFVNYFKLLQPYVISKQHKIMCMLFLLPSLHFWSVPISKDSLVFFLMSLLLIKLKNRKYTLLPIVFIAIGCIRPHIVVMLLLAFVLILFFEKKIDKKYITLGVLGLAVGSVFMLKFIKLSAFSLDAIYQKLTEYNNYGLKYGNSHIDILTTNYFERVFALLSRPLFIDAQTMFQYIVSFENIIVLIAIAIAVWNIRLKTLSLEAKYAMIVSVLLLLLISVYIYNLGLASRMRLMFLPYLFYSLCVGLNREKVNEKAS